MKTAVFSAAKKLSLSGTTVPRYLWTSAGCSRIACDIGMKITPYFASSAWNVVATETLSNTASTATPVRRFCSSIGIPSFSNVATSFGST